MTSTIRSTLLGSAVTVAAGSAALLFATPAMAQCVVSPIASPTTSVSCGTTMTNNTVNLGTSPAVDREYRLTTATTPASATITGAVTGNGLAFTNSVGGANALTVTNNGSVQINAGTTASQGGDDAINISAIDGTSVTYSGAGDITNLGNAGGGLSIVGGGTGNLTALVGGNVTSTASGSAITVYNFGTAGNVLVTTAAGKTITGGGIFTSGVEGQILESTNSGSVTVNNAATVRSTVAAPNSLDFGVLAFSTGTGSVTLNNTGAVGSATDRTGVGLYGGSVNSASITPLTVTNGAAAVYGDTAIYAVTTGAGANNVTTGTGIVNGIDFGINSDTFGTGTTTIQTGTGAVTASGPLGIGIDVSGGGTGMATITTGGTTTGGATAIQAVTTGIQNITVNGVTTGTTGSGINSNTTANRTIAVGTAGNVTGGTQAILLANTGTATINNAGTIGAASTGLALNTTGTGAVTLNNNGGIINGRLTLNAGNDLFNNAGIFNTQGTSDFGTGVDTLNNSGSINLTGATIFANLENFTNSGNVSLNTFTLTGPAVAFVNNGTVNTSGSAGLIGFTSFTNNNGMTLGAGTFTAPAGTFTNNGTLNAVSGATTVMGQANFANTGTINLQDGAPNDTLTINSNFVGSGNSMLNIDASDTLSDRLVINGAASGSTLVNANLTGNGAFLAGNGLLVVDTTSTSANAFTLGNVSGNTSPLLDYRLTQVGPDYYLDNSINALGFAPASVGTVAQDFWYQSADQVIANNQLPDNGTRAGPWAMLYYGHDKTGDSNSLTLDGFNYDVNNKVTTDRSGIQAGYGFGFGGVRAGVTAGWANADAEGDVAGTRAHGWNIGGYAGFGGAMGIHGSALAKYDRYDVDMSGPFDDTRGRSIGVDGEVGYRFGALEGTSFDLNAGVSHVRTKIRGIDTGVLDYEYGSLTSTRGRLGARANFGGAWGWFVDGKAYHEFDGDSDVTLSDGVTSYDIGTKGRGTWGRLEAGFGGAASGAAPTLSAYADFGDVKGFGVRAGMRF